MGLLKTAIMCINNLLQILSDQNNGIPRFKNRLIKEPIIMDKVGE